MLELPPVPPLLIMPSIDELGTTFNLRQRYIEFFCGEHSDSGKDTLPHFSFRRFDEQTVIGLYFKEKIDLQVVHTVGNLKVG